MPIHSTRRRRHAPAPDPIAVAADRARHVQHRIATQDRDVLDKAVEVAVASAAQLSDTDAASTAGVLHTVITDLTDGG